MWAVIPELTSSLSLVFPPYEIICMKHQNLFSGKNTGKKKITKCHLQKILTSMLCIKAEFNGIIISNCYLLNVFIQAKKKKK